MGSMHSRDGLAEGFRQLGVKPGDTVMLHASVRAVGPIAGGPDQIHLALKDALGPDGTLMMYAGCPDHYDEVGRGHLTPDEERELLEKLPAFDAATARSARDNGSLVELLRTFPDSLVNDHVARFVVWGRRASELIAEQPWDFAYGTGSALEKLAELDGRILLLGSDPDAVTFLHYAEHLVDVPGKRIARFKVPVLEGGHRVWRDMAEVDTSTPAHADWPERLFGDIVERYLEAAANRGGIVGSARAYLIDASGLLTLALEIMRSMASGR
jgi:aminoglycoside 3-N-acetyltransferase